MKWAKWELVKDSRDREWRYVRGTGLIAGRVRREFASGPVQEWVATTDGPGGVQPLGRYVGKELAERAVEVALALQEKVPGLQTEAPIQIGEPLIVKPPETIPLQCGERIKVRDEEWEVATIMKGSVATIWRVGA